MRSSKRAVSWRGAFYCAGFTLLEMIVASAVFSLMVVAIFQILVTAQRGMKSNVALDEAEGTATRVIDRLGRDVREASYAYVYAGDWLATNAGGTVSINVARNYFSASPTVGANALAPGISDEGWAQCPNPVCPWSTLGTSIGADPKIPHGYLARPIRNNAQAGTLPTTPLTAYFNVADAKGRLFGHIAPGTACPYCGTATTADAYFCGLLVFSPRAANGSYSYGGASGYEALWQSMVFYCPYRDPGTGNYGMRRYVFYASSILDTSGSPASLVDLLDFSGNGIIESPPMTRTDGTLALDADGEAFHLQPGAGGNDLRYVRWDTGAGRSFEITVNRATGQAYVTVVGGPFATGGAFLVQLQTQRIGLGTSDFDVSTFLNNPSWPPVGVPFNPTGVAEMWVVRVTFQVDRPGAVTSGPGLNREETVQSTMLRPQN